MITLTAPPPTLSNDPRPLEKWGYGASRIADELQLFQTLLEGREEDRAAQLRWIVCIIYILQQHAPSEVHQLHALKRQALQKKDPEIFIQAAEEAAHLLSEDDLIRALEYWAGVETDAQAVAAEPLNEEEEGGGGAQAPGKPSAPSTTEPPTPSKTKPSQTPPPPSASGSALLSD